MKRFVTGFLMLSLLALSQDALAGGGNAIDVMTQNQYLGADLTPIIAAPNPAAFNQALIDALEQIADNDYPTRSGLLADLVAKRLPDLVGLQEMFSFTCIPLSIPAPNTGCDDPAIRNAFNDHLASTLAALAARGEIYNDVAQVQNLNVTLPVDLTLDGIPDIAVAVIDRDVILARDGITAVAPVPYSLFCPRPSADGGPGCNYSVVAQANTALGPITIERGWVGVDAVVGGKNYRFVNTHLEVQRPDGTDASSVIQALQMAELITILGASTPPSQSLIVVGDINSSSEDPILPIGTPGAPPPFDTVIIPPYTQLAGSGYTDNWTLRPGNNPGDSCCQLSDLSNHHSLLDERIDVIFSVEVADKVEKARVLGDKISDKDGPFGVWPSDHGSVAAELEF